MTKPKSKSGQVQGIWVFCYFRFKPLGLKLLQKFSFEENNPNSLSVNFAWQKVQDPSGAIWVGTIGGGLNKIEP
jgi:hypothetical protein